MAGPGSFAGKSDFASVGFSPTYHLSYRAFKLSNDRDILLPAMNASAAGPLTRVSFYEIAGKAGSYRGRMANGRWIAFDRSTGLNWLTLAAELDAAIAITPDLSGQGGWKVDVGDGPQDVYYSVEQFAPILTLNPSESAGTVFAATVVTPSLATMRANGGRNADLSGVILDGADLSGIDFTGADFSQASLDGATCTATVFKSCRFEAASWGSATADAAVLDAADFTGADLSGAAWGRPASATGIVLTNCRAGGARLGDKSAALAMAGANLTGGDFTGADLSKAVLTGATLGRGSFERCRFDGADLSGADLTGGFFLGASMRGSASLARVRAQGANFVRADLSGADLSKAQMGSRTFLFYLAESFAADLDRYSFPQPGLIQAFSQNGVTLSQTAPVVVVAAGEAWQIDDPDHGPFTLGRNDQGTISVYRDTTLPPATLSGATLTGVNAASADFAGADLSGVIWNGSGASLDHATLGGATFAGSLLVGIDLTQAVLSGTDFSGAVLCQAKFLRTAIAAGRDGGVTRFDGAHLEGAAFDDASNLGGGYFRAAVALYEGVPLFRLPASAAKDLTPAGLAALAPLFVAAGFPIGATATIATVDFWTLDNAADPDRSSPRSYRVELLGANYQVFDGANAVFLFTLNAAFASQLRRATASAQLVSAFATAGFSLAAAAPITSGRNWQIRAGEDAGFAGPANYGQFTVTCGDGDLPVCGSVLLRLRDFDAYPTGIAFAGTSRFDRSLSADTVGPAGYPYRFVTEGRIGLLDYLTLAS
ncbi:pentapeptide repeat-containing protein [Jiella sonneratiae]|uniref:Pentapeptide repeat-containing protein n=1 Tax=Jiella sonneratiae TaxID=2816856 RepID=A0ABS3IXN7_9HYPH|nr:pentapeptide repeat-containing protein [Jiella sonneratiae]MBO0902172.1 pentapeptide repeat-containing protein [Jiella sonneratiae]